MSGFFTRKLWSKRFEKMYIIVYKGKTIENIQMDKNLFFSSSSSMRHLQLYTKQMAAAPLFSDIIFVWWASAPHHSRSHFDFDKKKICSTRRCARVLWLGWEMAVKPPPSHTQRTKKNQKSSSYVLHQRTTAAYIHNLFCVFSSSFFVHACNTGNVCMSVCVCMRRLFERRPVRCCGPKKARIQTHTHTHTLLREPIHTPHQ